MYFREQEKKEFAENRKNMNFKHSRLRLTLKRGCQDCWKGVFSDFHKFYFFVVWKVNQFL
jgi:hypothetical protein